MREFEMTLGDTAKVLAVDLLEGASELQQQPASAVLKVYQEAGVNVGGDEILTKAMTYAAGTYPWSCRFSGPDFATLGKGSFLAKVVATNTDTTQATFPTGRNWIRITVYDK